MDDDAELKQLVIGLVTQIYYANPSSVLAPSVTVAAADHRDVPTRPPESPWVTS
jgi:hypothetical protein